MRPSCRQFLSTHDAGALLEFAVCAPIIILLLTGVMEFAWLGFRTTLLEAGMREAARYGITGQDIGTATRASRIVQIVNSHANGAFTVSGSDVATFVYPDFSDIGKSEPFTDLNASGGYDSGEPFTDRNCNGRWDSDMGVAGAGAGGEVVLYTITHDLGTITGLLDHVIAPNGSFAVRSSVAVRNEPFNSGQAICAP